jgi:hypothetical protein
MSRFHDGYDSDNASNSHSDSEQSPSPVSPLDRLRNQLANLQLPRGHSTVSTSSTAQVQYASYVAIARQVREQTTGVDAARLYSGSNESRWTLVGDEQRGGASSPRGPMSSGDATPRSSLDETTRPPTPRRPDATNPRRGR